MIDGKTLDEIVSETLATMNLCLSTHPEFGRCSLRPGHEQTERHTGFVVQCGVGQKTWVDSDVGSRLVTDAVIDFASAGPATMFIPVPSGAYQIVRDEPHRPHDE